MSFYVLIKLIIQKILSGQYSWGRRVNVSLVHNSDNSDQKRKRKFFVLASSFGMLLVLAFCLRLRIVEVSIQHDAEKNQPVRLAISF